MAAVAVLGCGPAGLLAAHAARKAGHKVTVLSKKEKSPLGGAQFIHMPIPGYHTPKPDAVASYVKAGPPEGYAEKVYGTPHADTSWGTYPEGEYPVWSMQATYDRLWADWEGEINDYPLAPDDIPALLRSYARVVNTVPLKALCPAPHRCNFTSQSVWISYGREIPDALTIPEMTIIYNGWKDMPWYRKSNLFGWKSVEYGKAQDDVPTQKVTKPLRTDCDHHQGLLCVGRYGQWKKGVLSHHAYLDVERALRGL